MKPIVLKHFNCDAVTKYVVLGNIFSFDYAVECGVPFITFYDEDGIDVMEIESMFEISEYIDTDIINDDDYCISMETIIVDTIQEYIEEYLTTDAVVLDLNIVKEEMSNRIATNYNEFLFQRYKQPEV